MKWSTSKRIRLNSVIDGNSHLVQLNDDVVSVDIIKLYGLDSSNNGYSSSPICPGCNSGLHISAQNPHYVDLYSDRGTVWREPSLYSITVQGGLPEGTEECYNITIEYLAGGVVQYKYLYSIDKESVAQLLQEWES